ncbi:protein IQ-DOMAIN 3-like [Typha angustifolia]|uniref:protein IQ-DOMAIN 3-like n=1 Tax=Typha angustifolia TaxID=59011 RepID=UPI003C2E6CBE
MGRKGKWLDAVKKVFSPDSEEKRSKRKSKNKGKTVISEQSDPGPSGSAENNVIDAAQLPAVPPPPPPPPEEFRELRLMNSNGEQNQHAYSVALASAVAAEAAAVAAQAAAEVVRLTATTRMPGRSMEEISAIKIQTAFRGYLARRALRALRGLVRLKSLVDGNSVRCQTENALRYMQMLLRVQLQIRSRRTRMSEENKALQRQLQLKRERELEKSNMGEDWDDSLQSKEQLEVTLLSRQEAAIRRERALAYAFSHQWRSSSRSLNLTITDPSNSQWGWSWLERWMAARPWETSTATDKETNDYASIKSASRIVATEEKKASGVAKKIYASRETTPDRASRAAQKSNRGPSRQSPTTPPSTAPAFTRKIKLGSPRFGGSALKEDDLKSIASMQSERCRRHSVAGSSVRDDDSLASVPAIPSYMQSTESARARSRVHRSVYNDKAETPEKGSISSAKKRLSFPIADKPGVLFSGRVRRFSGPPKIDVASMKNVAMPSEQIAIDG